MSGLNASTRVRGFPDAAAYPHSQLAVKFNVVFYITKVAVLVLMENAAGLSSIQSLSYEYLSIFLMC
jgi:hypothetical protein